MTESDIDDLIAWVREQLDKCGLPDPSDTYVRFWRATLMMDELTGEYTSRRVSKGWETPEVRMNHWRTKLQEWRALRETAPEIYSYILSQLKEVRHGD